MLDMWNGGEVTTITVYIVIHLAGIRVPGYIVPRENTVFEFKESRPACLEALDWDNATVLRVEKNESGIIVKVRPVSCKVTVEAK